MNLLKKFIRDNNAIEDEDDEFNDLYVDDDVRMDMEEGETAGQIVFYLPICVNTWE